MKALTLIQPWGTAIIHHGKTLENRPWAPPLSMVGQRIAIHAGKKVDKDDAWNLMEELPGVDLTKVSTGCILGTVQLAGFYVFDWKQSAIFDDASYRWNGPAELEDTTILDSKWLAEGTPCAWLVRSPLALSAPISCKGALGLWTVPAEHEPALRALESA